MEINGHTRLIGLIGNPVEHTLSPVIHNGISKAMGVQSVYVPFKVEADGLATAVHGAYELNILGMNVTVPHKNDVMEHVVELDEAAQAIGAVNTLVRVEDKQGYKGYNTDMMGLRRQIQEDGISLQDETVVILGAGGAAKSVVYMCLLEGAKKIYLLNRTVEKAQQIADSMNRIIAMSMQDYNQITEDNLIVFQATSIGLAPHVEDVVLDDIEFYKKVKVGVDLIYNPANTRFMQLVTQAGGRAYNALKMLLYQAVIAYELWHDRKVPQDIIDDVYIELKRKVYPKDNIVLIGFMGSGKTTFGKACAKKLGMEFLDADEYIVNKAGKSIPQIFAEDGEEAFRQLETEVLMNWRDHLSNTVLATGGGMPLRKENARLLKEIGRVEYLTATTKEIYDRVKGDTNRPLLQCDNPYEKICELMKQRKCLYENAADVVIDTNSNDLDAIVEDMMHVR
ncbi:MAG: shikimate dehydrogenase [Lachnospiraceae bacterium]|nr:shikimate dehydrogenase [Lachnospiraceae bacterium]